MTSVEVHSDPVGSCKHCGHQVFTATGYKGYFHPWRKSCRFLLNKTCWCGCRTPDI